MNEWTDDEVLGRLTRTASTPWGKRLAKLATDFMAQRREIVRLKSALQDLEDGAP